MPWVWIFVLAFGPVVTAFLNNQWLYVGVSTFNLCVLSEPHISAPQTRTIAENRQHYHSARLRAQSPYPLKSRREWKGRRQIPKKAFRRGIAPQKQRPSTAVEASEDTAVETDTEVDDDNSDSETVVSVQETEKSETKPKTSHIVGRINNLITSDLTTLDYSYASLLMGECL